MEIINRTKIIIFFLITVIVLFCIVILYFGLYFEFESPQKIKIENLYEITIRNNKKIQIEKVDPWMSRKYIRIKDETGLLELYDERSFEINCISIFGDSCIIIVSDIEFKKKDTIIIKYDNQ